jgi:membrane protein implicated in regulation of membrane protease activity
MITRFVNRFSYHTIRSLKYNSFLFYFLHPALMILTGYYIVNCPLPVQLKTALFGVISLLSGWLLYRLLMPTSRQTDCPFETTKNLVAPGKAAFTGSRKAVG